MEEKRIAYALVKYNVVLNITVWESDTDFENTKELLYKDPWHPKDSEWIRVPDNNLAIAKGHIFNREKNYFYSPQPYPSWILDDNLQGWVPPIKEPGWPYLYDWDEEKLEWKIKGRLPVVGETDEEYLDNLLECIDNGVI